AQLAIGEAADLPGHRAVVDQRGLLGPALGDMAVERVVAGVEPTTREPAVERRARRVEHAVPAFLPGDGLGGLAPEAFWVGERAAVGIGVAASHGATYSYLMGHRPTNSAARPGRSQ